MPERDSIINNLRRLPSIDIGKTPKRGEAWRGSEDGVEFIVTKQPLLHAEDPTAYFLLIKEGP